MGTGRMSEPMRPVPIMTVLIKQTSSLQSIGKCGARVVGHGAQRHTLVCLDHTQLGERFLDGDGVCLLYTSPPDQIALAVEAIREAGLY